MQINQLINLDFCAMALMSSGRDLELEADEALRTPGGPFTTDATSSGEPLKDLVSQAA